MFVVLTMLVLILILFLVVFVDLLLVLLLLVFKLLLLLIKLGLLSFELDVLLLLLLLFLLFHVFSLILQHFLSTWHLGNLLQLLSFRGLFQFLGFFSSFLGAGPLQSLHQIVSTLLDFLSCLIHVFAFLFFALLSILALFGLFKFAFCLNKPFSTRKGVALILNQILGECGLI